jgi:hypothetical protein
MTKAMKVKLRCVAVETYRKIFQGAKTVKKFRKLENGRQRSGRALNYLKIFLTQKSQKP